MELWVFLAVVQIVLLFLARGRFGRGSDSAARRAREGGEPIGYGARIAPPGTPPQASTDVGWFSHPHDGDGRGRGDTSSGAE